MIPIARGCWEYSLLQAKRSGESCHLPVLISIWYFDSNSLHLHFLWYIQAFLSVDFQALLTAPGSSFCLCLLLSSLLAILQDSSLLQEACLGWKRWLLQDPPISPVLPMAGSSVGWEVPRPDSSYVYLVSLQCLEKLLNISLCLGILIPEVGQQWVWTWKGSLRLICDILI